MLTHTRAAAKSCSGLGGLHQSLSHHDRSSRSNLPADGFWFSTWNSADQTEAASKGEAASCLFF